MDKRDVYYTVASAAVEAVTKPNNKDHTRDKPTPRFEQTHSLFWIYLSFSLNVGHGRVLPWMLKGLNSGKFLSTHQEPDGYLQREQQYIAAIQNQKQSKKQTFCTHYPPPLLPPAPNQMFVQAHTTRISRSALASVHKSDATHPPRAPPPPPFFSPPLGTFSKNISGWTFSI